MLYMTRHDDARGFHVFGVTLLTTGGTMTGSSADDRGLLILPDATAVSTLPVCV